jgi:dTDP-glucose 4,6-dehydratase
MERNPLEYDLEGIMTKTRPLWEDLRGQRIFITGGTGFFGVWLLESLAFANETLNLGLEAVILSRNPTQFAQKCPHLAYYNAFHFLEGDVRDFKFPAGNFSHVIHAATEASATLNIEQPLTMLDTISQGTRQTLEFAKSCGAKRFLFVSSGAVYGRQPPDVTHLAETYRCQLDVMNPCNAYGLGKCMAEHMCMLYGRAYHFQVKIARCFAFVGPYLPINGTYAIGNFIRDALQGDPIVISGDGTPYRSYLYAADLVVWLLNILIKGEPERPYNVGSDQDYTLAEIAQIVADQFEPQPSIRRLKQPIPNQVPERYVPDITRARTELQLTPSIGLSRAIQLTRKWHFTQQTLTRLVTS